MEGPGVGGQEKEAPLYAVDYRWVVGLDVSMYRGPSMDPDVCLLPSCDGLPLWPEGLGGSHVHRHSPGLLFSGCLCVGLTVCMAFLGSMTEMHMNPLSLLAVQIIGLYRANFRLLITPLETSQERVGYGGWEPSYGEYPWKDSGVAPPTSIMCPHFSGWILGRIETGYSQAAGPRSWDQLFWRFWWWFQCDPVSWDRVDRALALMGVGRIQWNLGPGDDLQNSGYCDVSLHAAGERSPIIQCPGRLSRFWWLKQTGLRLVVSATPGHPLKTYPLVPIFLCFGRTGLCFPSPRNCPR